MEGRAQRMDEFDSDASCESATSAKLLDRMCEIASRLGIHSIKATDELVIFPHSTAGETRVSLDAAGEPVLRFYTTHQGHLGFADIAALGEFANDWNHDCISPRVVVNYADPTAVTLWGHTFLVVQDEPQDSQLEAALVPALRNAGLFLNALANAFPTLRSQPSPAEDSPASEDSTAEVLPVDIARVEDILRRLGINRFQTDAEQSVYAWINDVLFAFVLDVGPSLIIKGHWDPNLKGEDFTRIFLTCNDWNRTHHSAAAFCHSNVDGLQVRLDYAVMAGGGLTDAQLLTSLGRGMKHILHGIDDIAREAVGASPVQWP